MFGSGAEIGLSPPNEFKFVIVVNPVGNYYGNGPSQGVPALIKHGYDRAAPYGTVFHVFTFYCLCIAMMPSLRDSMLILNLLMSIFRLSFAPFPFFIS